jgi:hypothetical protein
MSRDSTATPVAYDIAFAFCVAVAVILLEGVLSINYREPLDISGDHSFLLVQARSMVDGVGFWVNPYLGFPMTENTFYFPQFEAIPKSILFLIAHLGVGPFLIIKLWYFTMLALTGAASYWAFRQFDLRPALAAVGAVAFIVSPFFYFRSVAHDYLALYLSVPFGAALAVQLATSNSTKEMLRRLRSPFAIVAAIVVAAGGLYYTFFACIFICSGSLVAASQGEWVKPVVVAVTLCAGMAMLMIVGGFGPQVIHILHASQPHRLALEQLFHGLSLADGMVPFGKVIKLRNYYDWRPSRMVGEGILDWPSTVQTLIIFASPILLFFVVARRASPGTRLAIVGVSAAYITLGIVFASRGGLGFVFNYLVSPDFRGQGRIIPYLAFFAVLISLQWTEMVLERKQVAGYAIPALLLAAMIPSVGALSAHQASVLADPAAVVHIASLKTMLAAKDRAGLTHVLELPITKWPEVSPANGFDFYNMQLPFVFDRSEPPTTWSYGASDLDLGYAQFVSAINEKADGVSARAASLGFDGILVEKQPYAPAELNRVRADLHQTGGCVLFEDAWRLLMSIKPCS